MIFFDNPIEYLIYIVNNMLYAFSSFYRLQYFSLIKIGVCMFFLKHNFSYTYARGLNVELTFDSLLADI